MGHLDQVFESRPRWQNAVPGNNNGIKFI